MKLEVKQFIKELDISGIPEERLEILDRLVNHIQSKQSNGKIARLNFICTHNSRRSQFSQLWAKVMSDFYQIPIESYSGGTAVTAFNERAVDSLRRTGFEITREGDENPKYEVLYNGESFVMYSKMYDAPENPKSDFAAIMTCSDADENCPIILGCEERIPLRYEDPKAFDDTDQESKKYDERSKQIATELKYVFSKIAENE